MGWKSVISILVTVVILPRIVSYIYSLGYHNVVQRHYPGDCHVVTGTEYGAEDMELVKDGLAIISSGLRFVTGIDNPVYQDRRGQILLYDFNTPGHEAIPLTIEGDFNVRDFNPHGISVYTDQKGAIYLYVINHLGDFEASVVEKFLVDLDHYKLTYLRTLGVDDNNFHVLNDVAVVGEDQFYYTNYYYYRRSYLENILQPKWGSIGYYNGEAAELVHTNLFKPNGLFMSADHRTLYLANFYDQSISVYSVVGSGSLHLDQTIELHSSPDNVIIHEQGDDVTLYVGCMQIPGKTRSYIHNPRDQIAPSQVLRVRLKPEQLPNVKELFSDDGRKVSASSSALVYQKRLLIGSIASHALICDLVYSG